MRLSHGKINHLSHLVLSYLKTAAQVEFFEEENEIRLAMVRIITEELKDDEGIDIDVRRKIESQKREIPEGSEEWEILYRKYYDEELGRRRKVIS